MKYQANPVIVAALAILSIGEPDTLGDVSLGLEDGSTTLASPAMISRIEPKIGDYVVTQDDGYVYLNPKAVFERKYSPIPDAAEKAA